MTAAALFDAPAPPDNGPLIAPWITNLAAWLVWTAAQDGVDAGRWLAGRIRRTGLGMALELYAARWRRWRMSGGARCRRVRWGGSPA